ncbi:N-acetylglucosaminyl-diphospho-decaprenol L-rhamnosyltransferase [Variovorax sp. PBS-H4]|uniref:glycosyltransferase family 2 protein n=1 Tax=Variovorax sp. PBS-H4 TaxID=434008 RepID=UPI001317564F|nr:glycosyltransferase family 2 protein [Variovorax sp. PBS-H4]VTU40969.1 N-acetylglucosaminyl-diphospho-decaprenol L-rhamnosyltransferase [Variovorax sp. PBS-H4]
MKPRIDIVIVNWNAGAGLLQCIRSIIEYGGGLLGNVIVVDNGSSDGSEASVEGLPGVTVLRAGTNLGFGKACNLGAQASGNDYLLLLNPDTQLYPNSLLAPFDYLERSEHANVGICGIQMIDGNGDISPSCWRFPSVLSFAAQALGLNRLHAFRAWGHRMEDWDHLNTGKVDHVIGAFYLIRRSVFELLNGFDERFFVYFEDLDLSLRAHQAGWQRVYLASARAFHAGGGTSRQIKARRLFYSLRSRLQYGFKHFSPLQRWLLVVVTLLLEPVCRFFFFFLRGRFAEAHNTLHGYMLLCRALPAIFGGRRS